MPEDLLRTAGAATPRSLLWGGFASRSAADSSAPPAQYSFRPTKRPGKRRIPKIHVPPSPGWWAAAALTAVLLALSAAAISAAVVRSYPRTTHTGTVTAAQVAVPSADTDAADWVAANVGSTHVVACDVTLCALLRDRGLPATSLAPVAAGIADVERGDVAIITPLLRTRAGTALDAVDSADPLAVFGTGAQAVVVTPIALDGPTARAKRLAADHTQREAVGKALTANPNLTLTPDARARLAAGMVDARVCALLALLTGSHAITVAAFTAPGPGAAADVPSAGVVIGAVDGQAAAGPGSAASVLLGAVDGQQPPYQAMSAAVVPGSAGGLRVLFAQPAVLGLLGGSS